MLRRVAPKHLPVGRETLRADGAQADIQQKMPRFTDQNRIRALLETDRAWSVYALGDLAPGFFEKCEWYRTDSAPQALLLLYRAFDIPVLLTQGAAIGIHPLLDEIAGERVMYLSIKPEILPLVKTVWKVEHETAMWRMVIRPAAFRPLSVAAAERLTPGDLKELQSLYDDGQSTGEVPDFFYPAMIEQGVFFGIRENGALVAAAGTHLVAPSESGGAVGNVYVRRDRRGRGLAMRVTGAVTAELLRLNLRTVALNVNQLNTTAIHVYERLGYERHCAFYEGVASKL